MNTVVICAIICAFLALLLLIFALFAIGFLIGYRFEEKRIFKKTYIGDEIPESDEEKKAKREWKNFLKYDGSAPTGR